jgi:hypothetical protein
LLCPPFQPKRIGKIFFSQGIIASYKGTVLHNFCHQENQLFLQI